MTRDLEVAQVAQIFGGGQHTLGVCQTGIRFCRVFDDRQRAVAAPSCNGRRVSDVLAVRGRAIATVGGSVTGVHCYLIWRATPAPPALGPRAGKHVCTRPTSLATLPDDREAAQCVEPVMVRPACQISVNLFIGDKICGALADDRASGDQYFVRWVLLGYPLGGLLPRRAERWCRQ